MRARTAIASLALAGATAVGLGALPASAAATADSGPEPAAETTGCSFGQWPADVQGIPSTLAPHAATGVYLWHTTDGWHVQVTHPGNRPARFDVTVASSGRIYGVERDDEGRDDVTVSPRAKAVTLRAVDWGHLDGMAFRTACAEHIVVTGSIDGRPLTTDQVFIGADGHHPDSVPFGVERQR